MIEREWKEGGREGVREVKEGERKRGSGTEAGER